MKTYNCKNCNKETPFRHSNRNIYCSIQCQADAGYKTYIEEWKSGKKVIGNRGTNRTIKRYIVEQQNNKCAVCGITEWNNKPIVLELEHKDGDSNNNRTENLECICPNCHSQTDTYKNKNIGKGRGLRRARYAEGKSY